MESKTWICGTKSPPPWISKSSKIYQKSMKIYINFQIWYYFSWIILLFHVSIWNSIEKSSKMFRKGKGSLKNISLKVVKFFKFYFENIKIVAKHFLRRDLNYFSSSTPEGIALVSTVAEFGRMGGHGRPALLLSLCVHLFWRGVCMLSALFFLPFAVFGRFSASVDFPVAPRSPSPP